MPTGYTAKIPDGIDFRTYAMDCARAFGACIMLRDEPGGGEAIPDEFEPLDYNRKRIEEATAELSRVLAMTAEERDEAARSEYAVGVAAAARRKREVAATRAAYEAMLEQVRAWNPPTADHVGLREFMEQQIVDSIEFDCNEDPETESPLLTGEEWARNRIECLRDDIALSQKRHAEEVERTAQRNAWIKALRAALPQPTTAPTGAKEE